MPRRKFPSPEEYGRRLAEAKRRAERRKHETARKSENSFERALQRLEEQKEVLTAVRADLATLPRDVPSPADLAPLFTELRELQKRLIDIQAAIEDIDLTVPPFELPESVEQRLADLVQMVRQPIRIPVPAESGNQPPQSPVDTIFAGPVTLKVTGRDSNGDIDTVRVEPTRH